MRAVFALLAALGSLLLWLCLARLSADGSWGARYAEPGAAGEGWGRGAGRAPGSLRLALPPPHVGAPAPAAWRMPRRGEPPDPARLPRARQRRAPRCGQAAVALLALGGWVFLAGAVWSLQKRRAVTLFLNSVPLLPRGWEKQAPQRTTDGTPRGMRPHRSPQAAASHRYGEGCAFLDPWGTGSEPGRSQPWPGDAAGKPKVPQGPAPEPHHPVVDGGLDLESETRAFAHPGVVIGSTVCSVSGFGQNR